MVESDSPFPDRFLKLPYEKRLDGSNGIVAYQFCATLQARNSLRVLQQHGRLATADLRLSVLLNTVASGGSGGVSATAGTCGVVHGGARAELAPVAAQRIVAIAGDGDQGLIALAASNHKLLNLKTLHTQVWCSLRIPPGKLCLPCRHMTVEPPCGLLQGLWHCPGQSGTARPCCWEPPMRHIGFDT